MFMKEVNTQKLWTFEIGTQEGTNVPIWISTGFQQKVRQDSQNLNNDIFYITSISSAQCINGTGKHPESGILITCDDDDYSQGYGQIKEAFRVLTKDDTL